jgi:hypothetical protein
MFPFDVIVCVNKCVFVSIYSHGARFHKVLSVSTVATCRYISLREIWSSRVNWQGVATNKEGKGRDRGGRKRGGGCTMSVVYLVYSISLIYHKWYTEETDAISGRFVF